VRVKLVERRYTRKRLLQPRPPWEWRPRAIEGPPRVLLTNHHEPLYVYRNKLRIEAGFIDYCLRMYQQRITILKSLQVEFDDAEWDVILEWADWIEIVESTREKTWRIDSTCARKNAIRIDTPFGPRWAVPLHHYSESS
jgi:hypothetical protein